MGASKTHIFNNSQNTLAVMAKVLAHPARIAILEYVHKHQQCICNDLVSFTGLSQPTISQHLSEIKKAGLLKSLYRGRNLYYSLDHEKWIGVQQYFHALFTKLNNSPTKKTNGN